MKKMISVLLTCSMLFALASSASAADSQNLTVTNSDIPIYIAFVDAAQIATMDIQTFDYEREYEKAQNSFSYSAGRQEIKVVRVNTQTRSSSTDKIVTAVQTRIAETQAKGFTVTSASAIVPTSSALNPTSSSQALLRSSDEDYWLNNSYYWGNYQGQNIRYYFTSLAVKQG